MVAFRMLFSVCGLSFFIGLQMLNYLPLILCWTHLLNIVWPIASLVSMHCHNHFVWYYCLGFDAQDSTMNQTNGIHQPFHIHATICAGWIQAIGSTHSNCICRQRPPGFLPVSVWLPLAHSNRRPPKHRYIHCLQRMEPKHKYAGALSICSFSAFWRLNVITLLCISPMTPVCCACFKTPLVCLRGESRHHSFCCHLLNRCSERAIYTPCNTVWCTCRACHSLLNLPLQTE